VPPSQLCGRGKSRVLLLEASNHRAAQVRRAFTRACPTCQIEAVARPGEAIQRIDSQLYDAIILDLEALGLEGLELVREAADNGRRVPIVVFSTGHGKQTRGPTCWPNAVVCLFGSDDDLDSLPRYLADVLASEGLTPERQQLQGEVPSEGNVLDALGAFIDAASQASEFDQILQCAVEVARDAIPNVDVSVGQLIDEQAGLVVLRAPEDSGVHSEAESVALDSECIASSSPASTPTPHPAEASPPCELGPGIESCLVAPLVVQGQLAGQLSVGSRQADTLDESHQRMLTTLATCAAMAIERAQLARQVKASRERDGIVVESASDAMCLVDLEGWRFVEANEQAAKLTGYSVKALSSLPLEELHCVQEGSSARVTLRDLLASGRSSFEDLSLVRKDGRLVPVSIGVNTLKWGTLRSVQVVLRDVTARKEMEQRLIHTEKLAALGRLAASLAHEINNPLQALRSSISLLSKGPLDEDKRMRYVSIADQQVERLTRLVQRMLDFYRPSGEERHVVNINDLLEDTLALASKQLEHCGITVVKDLAPSLPAVGAVASYLRQVFINLVLYHVEAMPEGGRLTVKTGVDQSADQVVISFSDTGGGMPADELAYVFEPFYSANGKSGGLGLAVSYSIVEKHGGTMEVSSEEGAGTSFSVRLPLGGELVA
jgi:PAS domain S-box-containing protein